MSGMDSSSTVLQRDEDVLNWLRKAGFPVVAGVASHFEHGALLNCARSLRENIRLLVDKRKAGRRGDAAAALNGFLADAESHLSNWFGAEPRLLRIEKVRREESPRGDLGTPLQNLPPICWRPPTSDL